MDNCKWVENFFGLDLTRSVEYHGRRGLFDDLCLLLSVTKCVEFGHGIQLGTSLKTTRKNKMCGGSPYFQSTKVLFV